MFCYQSIFLISTCTLSIFINIIRSQDYQDEIEKCLAGVFKDIEIKTIADKNRNLRLNISWEEPLGNFDSFDLSIDTLETNCYLPNYYQKVNVNISFLIEPSLKMEHPAEKPSHSCKYNVSFDAENNDSCYREIVEYTVPDCVDTICSCEKGPPYSLVGIKELSNKSFEMTFGSTERQLNLSLEHVFNQIWYTRKDSTKHVTKVLHYGIHFDEGKKTLKFPLLDVLEGSWYVFHVDLFLDDCAFHFEREIQIKAEDVTYGKQILLYSVLLLVTVALSALYFLLKKWPRILMKFQKYLPFLPRVPDIQTTPQIVLSNEVENVQYVPLDFIDNLKNLDHYEIPRNKIVLKNKIGGGSFGEVFKCDFYPVNSSVKCIPAAAKMPIENAPEAELIDFQAEVKIMKKIAEHGGHRNVIKMFACVTIEKPYVMVMELVTNGSLKDYLKHLRIEWEIRKRNANNNVNPEARFPRHFFPDNMVVENYLGPSGINDNAANNGALKYSSISFEVNAESGSSDSESYVTPDGLRTPSTPLTPAVNVHIPSTAEEHQRGLNLPIVRVSPPTRLSKLRRKISAKVPNGGAIDRVNSTSVCGLNLPSPNSPESITSSGLPSCTETLLTPLELHSPVIEENLLNLTPTAEPVLDSSDLRNFALQLANGMAFLESIDVTHRDLAARNILINEQRVLKISDFGMARVGVYVNNPQKRQPLRWMAPEAIEERKCTTKSDVWSFGVVLWEIGSLGAFPYGDLSNDLVLVHIRQGKRLKRPEMCTDRLYSLMQQCWLKDPTQRPTFNEIAKTLDAATGKIYVDFHQISPDYAFPPVQQDNDG